MLQHRSSTILIIVFISLVACTEIQFAPAQQANDTATETSVNVNPDEISSGEGTGDATTDNLTALNQSTLNVIEILPYALQGGYSTSFQEVDSVTTRLFYQIHDCVQTGNIYVSGSITNASETTAELSFDVKLSNCDGLDSSYKAEATYFIAGNAINYIVLLNGSLGGKGCIIDLTDFVIEYSEDVSIGAKSYTYSGSTSAICENADVICDFSDGTTYQDAATACGN